MLDHHPVLAVTAVRHLNIDPGLLQRMQHRSCSGGSRLLRPKSRQPLECRDLLPGNRSHRGHTRPNLLPVQQHRAGTTLRKTTTKARPMQMQLVMQNVEKRRIKTRAHAMRKPVHADLQATRHTSSIWVANAQELSTALPSSGEGGHNAAPVT